MHVIKLKAMIQLRHVACYCYILKYMYYYYTVCNTPPFEKWRKESTRENTFNKYGR